MFDIGFSEMLVIAVVALLVLGPERLPRVARTVGHLLGRAQRYVYQVKSDIHREMHVADLKRMQDEIEASARGVEASVRGEVKQVEDALRPSSDDRLIHDLRPAQEPNPASDPTDQISSAPVRVPPPGSPV